MSEIIKQKIKCLKKSLKYGIILFGATVFLGSEIVAVYVFGIILGVITKNGCLIPSLYNGAYNYFFCVFDVYSSIFSILLRRILVILSLFIIFFALSLNKYVAPLSALIIFYRGLIIGCVSVVFFETYKISGGFVFFLVVIPQNLIITAGLISLILLNGENYCVPLKSRINDLIINGLLSLCVCLAGAIYEFIILTFVLRPITLWF